MARIFLRKTIPVLLFLSLASLPVICQMSHAKEVNPLEQLDFANGLFQRGLYQMAISEYKKIVESFPESEYLDEAYFGIAESLFFLKMYEEASTEYENYLKRFPRAKRKAISALRLGQSLFFMDRGGEALVSLNQVKESSLDGKFRQILYFYKGKILREKGNDKIALENFNKSVGVQGKTEYTVYSLLEIGDIYSKKSEYEKAIQYYDKAYGETKDGKLKSFALYKTAEAQFSSGDYVESASSFKNVLSGYPNDEISSEALANMLLSLFNTAEYERLVSEYLGNERLIGKDLKFFDVYYIAASAYTELERYDQALLALDKVFLLEGLSQNKKDKAILKKTEILIKAKRFNEVLELAKGDITSSHGNDTGYIVFLRAEAYYGLGSFNKAFELYTKLLEDFPSSQFSDNAIYGMAYTKKSLKEDKDAGELFVRYFKEGKDETKRMEALYNAILIDKKLKSKEKAIEHSLLFLKTFKSGTLRENVLFGLGSLYSEIKEYDKAGNIFKEFIRLYTESPKLEEAYFLLGYNLQLSKSLDEALLYYGKIMPGKNENKLFYSALKNKALIYLQDEKENEAAKVYDRIITELKDNDLGIDTYLWLSKYYLGEKRFNDALRILTEAESAPESKLRMKEIAYFRGETYRELKSFEKAIDNYDIVLSDMGEDVFSGASRIGKGLCLVELGELERAKSEFEEAILENSDDNTITMRARFELANIEQLKDELEEAYKLYMLVAILYNDDYYCPEALFRAGTIFEVLGKNDEARKVYQEIVDKYGKSHLISKVKKRLKALSEK